MRAGIAELIIYKRICMDAIHRCLLKDKGARQVADLAVTGYIGA